VGQPVIVDNKAGADGAIAGAEVAKAAPDGYTLIMATNSPMAVAPAMKKVPPYDPGRGLHADHRHRPLHVSSST
jgi:tripartite-type tricarboxylate transporter receptor subunit TctC